MMHGPINIRFKKDNIRKYTTFCGGINKDGESVKKIIK